MDVIALTIRRNSRKPQLVRNSKTSIHMSVQKISPTRYCAVILFLLIYFYFCEFQIVLQDHNYGADSHTSSVSPEPHSKCGGLNLCLCHQPADRTDKQGKQWCLLWLPSDGMP